MNKAEVIIVLSDPLMVCHILILESCLANPQVVFTSVSLPPTFHFIILSSFQSVLGPHARTDTLMVLNKQPHIVFSLCSYIMSSSPFSPHSPMKSILLKWSLNRWQKWASERLRYLPKVTQPTSNLSVSGNESCDSRALAWDLLVFLLSPST